MGLASPFYAVDFLNQTSSHLRARQPVVDLQVDSDVDETRGLAHAQTCRQKEQRVGVRVTDCR